MVTEWITPQTTSMRLLEVDTWKLGSNEGLDRVDRTMVSVKPMLPPFSPNFL
jgi:hypothetical protein